MAGWYAIKSIRLEDDNGQVLICPLGQILPLFLRTENKPVRLIEDKWLEWCSRVYAHQYTKIKIITQLL